MKRRPKTNFQEPMEGQQYALVFGEHGVALFASSPLVGIEVTRIVQVSKLIEEFIGGNLFLDGRIAATLGALCVWCTDERAVAWRAELGIYDGEERPAVAPLLDQESKHAEVKRALDSWLTRPTRKLCATPEEAQEVIREQACRLAGQAPSGVEHG